MSFPLPADTGNSHIATHSFELQRVLIPAFDTIVASPLTNFSNLASRYQF
jgi:hypothetical protein